MVALYVRLEDLPRSLQSGEFVSRKADGTPAFGQQSGLETSVTGIFVSVTRKLGLDVRVARRKVELLAEFNVAAPDVADILYAVDLHRLHGFSFWDSLILRAAIQSGCTVLLTEDFQESRPVDGVRIVNSFAMP